MKNLLWLIILMTPMALAAQTQVPAGPVSGTWDIIGSPYFVNGEIYIEETETLNIEAGVEVKFNGWYKFIVYGSLMAEGTETHNILFTANDTNNRWHGIQFFQTVHTSVLDHCIIEYGLTSFSGSTPTSDNTGGGILCWQSPNASITVKNSIIRNNQASLGGGIECFGSSLLVENCEITHNNAEWGGGIDAMFAYSSSAIVRNCIIENNTASMSGGGISAGIQCSLFLSGNSIMFNTAPAGAGIRIYDPDTVVVSNNIIARNQALNNGGGIGCWLVRSACTFHDNTIVFNMASNGGGIYLQNTSSPSFESDIIYFNTQQVYLKNSTCDPPFNYCDVQGGVEGFTGPGTVNYNTSLYTNCIDADPLFIDFQNNDFNLSWADYPDTNSSKSKCIDNGCPGMFPAPDGSCNDIGAMDFFQQLDKPDIYPNSEIKHNSFLAEWTECYGAIGYYLDVALDEGFTNMVMSSIQIEGDTSFLVEGLIPETWYYYRVKSYNYALTSDYSDIQSVLTLDDPSSTKEMDLKNIKLYAANHQIHIEIPEIRSFGDVYIYDLCGRLILEKSLNPGSNVITLNIPNQIVVVKVLIEGRTNQQKLLIH